jgi:hypothetical protein
MEFPLFDDAMNRHAEFGAVGVVVEMPADGGCLLQVEISARPPAASGQAISRAGGRERGSVAQVS